jgi:hypothetical protein
MMNQQPDKIFRDKLENLQRPAPLSAWDRIEAGLEKKTNPVWLWLKVAASLLVLAIASFILWPSQNNHRDNSQTAHENKAETNDSAKINSPKIKSPTKIVAPQPAAVAEKKEQSPKTTHKHKLKLPTSVKEENTVAANETIRKEKVIVPAEPAIVPKEEQPVIAENKNNPSTDTNIKIVITANDASKYLDKKSVAQATSPEKKTSTFKKLLEKAEDLTTNQDPLGDIRQKKNELLALNFKNEKQRGQNK